MARAAGANADALEFAMGDAPAQDWDPTASDVQADPLAAGDAMRERCPVAYSDHAGWTLFRHADAARAARSSRCPGARIEINWIAANRDAAVFEAPAQCRIERDQARNLLYGAGIHFCPGAALSRMQLRVVFAALLAASGWIALDARRPPTRARRPAAGFSELNLVIE